MVFSSLKKITITSYSCFYVFVCTCVPPDARGKGDELSTENIKTTSMAQSKSYGQFSIADD